MNYVKCIIITAITTYIAIAIYAFFATYPNFSLINALEEGFVNLFNIAGYLLAAALFVLIILIIFGIIHYSKAFLDKKYDNLINQREQGLQALENKLNEYVKNINFLNNAQDTTQKLFYNILQQCKNLVQERERILSYLREKNAQQLKLFIHNNNLTPKDYYTWH